MSKKSVWSPRTPARKRARSISPSANYQANERQIMAMDAQPEPGELPPSARKNDGQQDCDVYFKSGSIREIVLITRPKTSVVAPAAPSFLRIPSSSAA